MNFFRYTSVFIVTVFIAFTSYANAYSEWGIDKYKGDTYSDPDGNFMTYEVPEGYNLGNTIPPRFNVSINDQAYVGLFEDLNYDNGQITFGYFDMKEDAEVEVKVACRRNFDSYEILPKNLDISDISSDEAKSISFKVKKPNQHITLVLNNDFRTTEVLHLFVNPIEDVPEMPVTTGFDKKSRNWYFGPGYHEVPGGIGISGEHSVYIAPGAVVRAQIRPNSLNDQGHIYGHGILMMDSTLEGITIYNQSNSGGTIEGIIVNKRTGSWNVTFDRCKNMTIKNLKIVSGGYPSNDGTDFNYCENLNFENCFIRAMDDCVAIKGLNSDKDYLSADCPANKGLHFTKMQFWSDSNNAFGIGQESKASFYEDISLTDSDILYDWDDIYHSDDKELIYQASLNIACMSGTYYRNIRFEDIRLHHSDRAIAMCFLDNFYWGSIVTRQTDPGDMSDIIFKDIVSYTGRDKNDRNEIRFHAWYGDDNTPRKAIHDITFDNVVLEGNLVESFDDPHIKHNNREGDELIYDIHFLNTSDGVRDIQSTESIIKLEGRNLLLPEETDSWNIYNIQGMNVMEGYGQDVCLSALAPGIYLVKTNLKQKFITTKIKL